MLNKHKTLSERNKSLVLFLSNPVANGWDPNLQTPGRATPSVSARPGLTEAPPLGVLFLSIPGEISVVRTRDIYRHSEELNLLEYE